MATTLVSPTQKLIEAYNTLYTDPANPAEPGAPALPPSLPNYKATDRPVIKRWTFPGATGLGPGFIDPTTVEGVQTFIAMPDSGVIENCIGFHWYDTMFKINDKKGDPGDRFPPYHLIYAYLIENSRIVPIFERIMLKYMTTEDLGHASPFTAHWVRNTQSLFYKDLHIPNFRPLLSSLLPNLDATRRNAYHRLFGLELSHGNQENAPVPFVKSAHANLNFVPLLENLLREIWQGVINHSNTSGANTTDLVALTDTAKLLKDSMLARRNDNRDLTAYESSSLSKEEFFSVIMLDWFYQVIASKTKLVEELNAEAVLPADSLAILGKHVGITPHSKTRDLFALAPLLAMFLRMVEEGFYDKSANIKLLFDPAIAGTFAEEMSLIITLWQKTTGRNLKQMPNASYAMNGQRISNGAAMVPTLR